MVGQDAALTQNAIFQVAQSRRINDLAAGATTGAWTRESQALACCDQRQSLIDERRGILRGGNRAGQSREATATNRVTFTGSQQDFCVHACGPLLAQAPIVLDVTGCEACGKTGRTEDLAQLGVDRVAEDRTKRRVAGNQSVDGREEIAHRCFGRAFDCRERKFSGHIHEQLVAL